MQITLQTFGNQFQEEMTQMVESGLTDAQIQQRLEVRHSLTIYWNNLTKLHLISTEAAPFPRFTTLLQQAIIITNTNNLDSQQVEIEKFLFSKATSADPVWNFGPQVSICVSLHDLSCFKKLDPFGVDNKSRRVLKQQLFKKLGPNLIWSADGHNKLKKIKNFVVLIH
ncbi:hypothetical protein VP01_2506g2 [Puccinia sorghi]|uniref:Uncharacterized protein n=1 Tax=Puccinia sorghi TaxID=27349 RepID=A0A0L6V5I3_9BASI|nr:hypothetical protein VP01_2506g2 [Puccinia sorghi]